jgi:hypothetical protein
MEHGHHTNGEIPSNAAANLKEANAKANLKQDLLTETLLCFI